METVDYYNLNERDQKAWELVCSGRTKGVFQLDSNLGQSWAKRLQPIDIEEMSDLSALLRPGAMNSMMDEKSMTQHYVDRKFGIELDNPIHPSLFNVLKDTYQILVYQEQSMAIARELAGFTLEQADNLRKAIGKKSVEIMNKCEVEFLEGCRTAGVVDNETASKIFNMIRESQKYQFNKCLNPTTIVEKEDGKFIEIQDIVIGDKINTPEGYVKVLNKFDNGVMDIFEITTETGKNIECTLQHKFLCDNGEILPLIEIFTKNLKIMCEED